MTKSTPERPIAVEVKVIGMFGLDSIAVAETVRLPAGARVKDALEALHRTGAIDQAVFAQVRKPRPPFFLVLNDEKVGARGLSAKLADGDVVTVMQLMAGG